MAAGGRGLVRHSRYLARRPSGVRRAGGALEVVARRPRAKPRGLCLEGARRERAHTLRTRRPYRAIRVTLRGPRAQHGRNRAGASAPDETPPEPDPRRSKVRSKGGACHPLSCVLSHRATVPCTVPCCRVAHTLQCHTPGGPGIVCLCVWQKCVETHTHGPYTDTARALRRDHAPRDARRFTLSQVRKLEKIV